MKVEEVFLVQKNTLPIYRRKFVLWLFYSLAIIATLVLAACGGGSTTTGSSPTATSQPTTAPSGAMMKVQIVEQNNKYAFSPATLTIAKGSTVEWTNMSDALHTVTSDGGSFNTQSNLTQSQTFMFTFNTAGTFTYHCNVHPYMKATITVTA